MLYVLIYKNLVNEGLDFQMVTLSRPSLPSINYLALQEGREVPGAGLTQSDESLCATQNAAGTFSAQTRRQLHGNGESSQADQQNSGQLI